MEIYLIVLKDLKMGIRLVELEGYDVAMSFKYVSGVKSLIAP